MVAIMEDALIGRVIASKFAIEALIGSGAMGVVYRARHLALDMPVAVKVLHQSMANDATFAARLRREALAASLLDHPNSVRIVDFGEEPDGLLYIAMELLDGLDLLGVIARDWPFADCRTVDLISQTLSALAMAHERGIIHRDLKPENIMIVSLVDDEGRPRDLVKVCDFGIAKIADTNSLQERRSGGPAITMQNAILGTPEYMSPEQCRGEPTDARSDLYSVGVVLYQLLAGRVPFHAAHALDVLFKHLAEEPTPPSHFCAGVPPELEAVCLRALRKRPDERFASAREMRAELRAAADRLGVPPNVSPAARQPSVDAGSTETLSSLATAKPASESPAPTARDAIEAAAPARGPTKTITRTRARRAGLLAVAVALLGAAAIVRPWKRPAASPPADDRAPAAQAAMVEAPALPPEPKATGEDRAPPPPTLLTSAAQVSAPRRARVPTSSPAAAVASPLAASVPVEPRPLVAVGPTPAPPASTPSNDVASPPAAPSRIESPPRADGARFAAPAAEPTRAPPRRGRLSWSVTAAGGGASTGAVARALARVGPAWQRCYDAGLTARSGASEESGGSGTMRLTCDDQGRVVAATVSGLDMGDVASCIRASASGVTIPNADTGEAWATVALAFKVIE
jgi:serine/threonine protein kinase